MTTTMTIEPADFRAALRLVKHALPKDQTRPVLRCVLVEDKHLVAADNFRLARVPFRRLGGDARFLIPADSVKVLRKWLAGARLEVTVTVDAECVRWQCAGRELTTPLPDYVFPEYAKKIIEDHEFVYATNLAPMFLADFAKLGRVIRISPSPTGPVRIEVFPAWHLNSGMPEPLFVEYLMPVTTPKAVASAAETERAR